MLKPQSPERQRRVMMSPSLTLRALIRGFGLGPFLRILNLQFWMRCSSRQNQGRRRFSFIFNTVAVSLLRQEELAVLSEIQLAGVARDQGVKVGELAVRFRAQDSSQALGFLLPGTESSRNLNQNIGIGQIQGEIADLGEDQSSHFALSKALIKLFALGGGGLAGDQGNAKALSQSAKLP